MKSILGFKWATLLLPAIFCITFNMAGCHRSNDTKIYGRRAITEVMDSAERIIDYDPTHAYELMSRIDSSSVRGRTLQARYALLYTAAMYKNYKPIKSDSLIMKATLFYSIDKYPDYLFLSYYYLGCVYVELKQYTDAAVALAQAEQLSDRVDNDYWKGLLYSKLGDIFDQACDYYRAEQYYTKAKTYYWYADRELHRVYALSDISRCKVNNLDFRTADSLLQIVEDKAIAFNDDELYDGCQYYRLYCALCMNETKRAVALYRAHAHSYERFADSPGYQELMALYYNSIRDYARSESYMEKAWNSALSEGDSIYLYYVSSLIAKSRGEADESLEYYEKYNSFQNANLRSVLSQPLLGAQNEHYKIMAENEQLKYRHAMSNLILFIVIFLLINVIALVTYYYKRKQMKEQLFDSLTVVEELTAVNHKNKDMIKKLRHQLLTQFHERHDMSNRLYSMYFDSENQEKITKQQLTVTINNLIRDYTAPENVKKLDALINESYDGIMDKLSVEDIGLSEKEKQLLRFSFAGLSSKSVSVIIKESPQNIYQIKSRLLKKVKKNSEDLWMALTAIWQ
ncbi:MAG: hypothetical protein J6P66_10835 [Bacteroidaceae bacterium]|nr:hypothetical protein [Bacteroidaceae bacterium]